MKSFDEWFEETYKGSNYNKQEIDDRRKIYVYIWQAAQEVQRESDADLIVGYGEAAYIVRSNKVV